MKIISTKLLAALALIVLMGVSVTSPAQAGWDHRGQAWHHGYWGGGYWHAGYYYNPYGGAVIAPGYYPGYYYAPTPVVYAAPYPAYGYYGAPVGVAVRIR